MNQSFYTAALGVGSEQYKLDILANNTANLNTWGYKTKVPIFSELMYYEMKGKVQEDSELLTGTGMRIQKADTDFSQMTLAESEGDYHYAIEGDGMFMLRDPATNRITYTRDGSFSLSLRGNDFYLVTSTGKLVLDQNRQPILVNENSPDTLPIGIFDFVNKNGMLSEGENEFTPVAKNGNPIAAEGARLRKGMLEMSNVDLAEQMTKVIEAQRAYSYALRMVQTSDEIENTINTLRT